MPYYKAIIKQLPNGQQVVEQVIFEPLEMNPELSFNIWKSEPITKPKKIKK